MEGIGRGIGRLKRFEGLAVGMRGLGVERVGRQRLGGLVGQFEGRLGIGRGEALPEMI